VFFCSPENSSVERFQVKIEAPILLKKENAVNKKQKEEVALFRFGVICDLVWQL